jgi:hypothetical protein
MEVFMILISKFHIFLHYACSEYADSHFEYLILQEQVFVALNNQQFAASLLMSLTKRKRGALSCEAIFSKHSLFLFANGCAN